MAQVDAAGVIQYLHTDNIGSVRLITSSTGAVVGSSDYTPYGAVAAHTGTAVSNFGFATAWADPDTHLNYLRARDYDPAMGQFVQVDPVVDATHQPYAYVAGDPLASIDPTGLCVGLDGTPQDRNCTYNDYYWDGVWGSIGDQFEIAWAGFSAGATFGVGLLTNDDQACYGGNPEFWVEYALGGIIGAASLGLVAAKAAAVATAEVSSFAAAEGATSSTLAEVTFGHGARHLIGTGLSEEAVESSISAQITHSAANATGSFWGRTIVGGKTIEYRAFTLADGSINVGTYYVR